MPVMVYLAQSREEVHKKIKEYRKAIKLSDKDSEPMRLSHASFKLKLQQTLAPKVDDDDFVKGEDK